MIAYVLPTRNRPECLARTLDALGALARHDAEVIVVDNASLPPAHAPAQLANGLPVRVLRRPRNEGAAARNEGVRTADAGCEWVVMLDDDSHPVHPGFLRALDEQPDEVAAVCAEILLPSASGTMRHESGGLPEVPIGCAVAYRREAFLAARVGNTAGYDPSFGFYAEEYDLAARLIMSGRRIVFDRRFEVLHEKTAANRSMDAILGRLVRNNSWVMARYAPGAVRSQELCRTIGRYARIAVKERALLGYAGGLARTLYTVHRQARMEMNAAEWDRFTGKAACRRALLGAWAEKRFGSAAIVAPGKNEHVVRECLAEMGVELAADQREADALVIGTLSPGPALDAFEMLRADSRMVAPWPCPATIVEDAGQRAAKDAA